MLSVPAGHSAGFTCGISEGTARARWYLVPVPGAGPFTRMTLGGMRSAGILLSGMGMEDAKQLWTLHPLPAHFVGI